MPFAESRSVKSPAECWFYHVMDLPGFGTVGEQWDLRGRINDYIGHVDVRGKRVLDIGTASGFLTFEMEKMGADVVSFDADSPARLYLLPFKGELFTADRAAWIAQNDSLRRLQNGYWFAHRVLGSKARAFYGDVYDLPDEIGHFDIGLIGQILVHLSDPIRALASVMRRCDRLVITEGMMDDEKPTATLLGSKANGLPWAWWQYSIGLYREVLSIAGWEIESIKTASYRCLIMKPKPPSRRARIAGALLRRTSHPGIALTTIVARRAV
jgi:SAM-dependent methyltransferase